MKQSPVFLRACAHSVGEPRPIESLPDAHEHVALLARLRRLGLSSFRRLSMPLRSHMLESTQLTLRRAGLVGSDIEAVIDATASFDYRTRYDELSWLCNAAGIAKALPVGLFQGFCANFTLGTLMARNFIQAAQGRQCLIVTADEWDEGFATRVLQGGATIASDGAASFVLAEHSDTGYRVRSLAHVYIPAAMQYVQQSHALRYIQHYADGVTRSCKDALREAGVEARDCKCLVTGNYNSAVQKNLSELLGIPPALLFCETRADYAHCYAADPVIALERLDAPGRLSAGDLVLISVQGNDIFGAMVVEYIGPEPSNEHRTAEHVS